MKRPILYVLVALAAMIGWMSMRPQPVAAGDGIPDNCEYTNGAYYQPNVFARYEPQNQRLMLVNWTTGVDVTVVASGLGDTRIQGWSLDCRYLAAAVGTLDSMDTVVWDVTIPTQIGHVPDAHLKPHYITWGPRNFLVVETRDGAVLWNVPTNTQIKLDTGFNTTSMRNFSRLRWDATNNQLIGNLAVGGRIVYDLNTGQQIPVAANVTDSVPGTSQQTITIGGKAYDCFDDYRYGYDNWFSESGSYAPNIQMIYNATDHLIALILNVQQSPAETLLILENTIGASSFHFRGWSPGCRYVVASLGVVGRDATDTVAWDVATGKRIGSFPDARKIEHPIHWSPAGNMLLIETRDGVYIWHLDSDQRVLVNANVETAMSGASQIRSFYEVGWDIEKGQFLGVAVENPEVVTAYDVNSGEVVGTYQLSIMEYQNSYVPLPDTSTPTMLPNIPVDGISGMSDPSWYSYLYNTDGYDGYGCNGVHARFFARTRKFALIDLSSHEIIFVIEENSNPVSNVFWSPNCEYLSAHVSTIPGGNIPYDAAPLDDTFIDELSYEVVFWNVKTGMRLQSFARPYEYLSPALVVWSPNGERAIVRTTLGHFLFNLTENTSMLLTYPAGTWEIDANFQIYWDYQRGQVLISGWQGVLSFDMRTGIGRYAFSANPEVRYFRCRYGGCHFSVTHDNKILYIATLAGLSVWNLDTLQNTRIDLVLWNAYIDRHGTFSPNDTHFVITNTKIRVWDLTTGNLTGQYEGPQLAVRSAHFIDNTTIETTDSDGNIQYWNILTGEEVPKP